MTDKNIIIVLEIGSSALRAAAAEVSADSISVIDVATEKLDQCVRIGRIQNVEDVTNAARRSLDALESCSALDNRIIKAVYVAVGGRSLEASYAEASLQFPDEREITQEALERLTDEACNSIPESRELLDILPRKFMVNGMDTKRPRGNLAKNITAQYSMVHCNMRNMRNLETVIGDRLKLDFEYITRPLAEAEMALSDREIKGGCVLVDFGAETTTVSIYKDGVLQYLTTIPLGSEAITCDLASALSVTEDQAREIKERVADIMAEKQEDARIKVINNTVRERAMQIIANILKQIEFAGFENKDIAGGIIVTGGGSLLRHFVPCLEKYAKMPVRPAEVSGIQVRDNTLVSSTYFPLMAAIVAAARSARRPEPLECLQVPAVTPIAETDDAGLAVDNNDNPFDGSGSGVEVPPGKNYEGKGEDEDGIEEPAEPGGAGPSGFNKFKEKVSKMFNKVMSGPDGADDMV